MPFKTFFSIRTKVFAGLFLLVCVLYISLSFYRTTTAVSHYATPQRRTAFIQNLQNRLHTILHRYSIRTVSQIATYYAEETADFHPLIRTLHPFDRDKEVVQTYLIDPFKKSLTDLLFNVSEAINAQILQETESLYDGFFAFCRDKGYRCSFEDDSLPIVPFVPYLPEMTFYDARLQEEGKLINTVDALLGWVPVAGDLKELFGVDFSDKPTNRKIALEYMQRKIDLLEATLTQEVTLYAEAMWQRIATQMQSCLKDDRAP